LVPSLEAFALVAHGQAASVRFDGPSELSRMTIVDMRPEYAPKGQRKMISKVLEFRIAESLEKKERMLFFVPQKGFSTYLYCPQ
jgi:primosomal protein N'